MANVASTIQVNVQANGVNQATNQINSLGHSAELAKGLITGMATALAGFAIDGLLDATKEALEFGDALVETAQRIGVTAESLQRMQSLAFDLNTDVKSLTDAFESSKEMIGLYELGSSKATKAIGLLGTEVKNAIKDGKSAEDIFLLQVKALSEYTDESERAAVAQRAGLGAMLDMATAYANGSMTIDELKGKMAEANVLTEEQAQKASELNDKWDKLANSLNNEVKGAIIDNAEEIANITTKLIQATSAALQFVNALANGMGVMGSFAIATGSLTKKDVIRQELSDAKAQLDEVQKDWDNLKPEARSQKDIEYYEQKKAKVQNLTKAMNDMNAAEKQIQDAQKKMQDEADKPAKPSGRPVGAGTLAKDDNGGSSKRGGSNNHEAELKKQLAEEQRYADEVARITDRLADNKNSIIMKMTSNNIEHLHMERDAALKSQDDVLNKTKLVGKDLEDAKRKVEENKLLISKQYAQKEVEVQRDAERRINSLLDQGELELAKSEKDKLKAVQLSTKAQIKSYEDRYDAEIKAAKDAGKDTVALERQKAQMVAMATRQGKDEEIRVSGSYFEKMKLYFSEQGTAQSQFTDDMVNMTTNAFDGMATSLSNFATTGKANFKEFALSIIKDIEAMILKALIFKALSAAFGFGTADAGGAVIAQAGQNYAANGAVFDGSNAQFFAEGGVVDRATPFAMSNGKTGVMGEAGPEAIMPLARGADGKLGVKGSGSSGGGNNVQVGAINVVVKSDPKSTPNQQGMEIGQAIKKEITQLIRMEVQDMHRPGNSLNQTRRI